MIAYVAEQGQFLTLVCNGGSRYSRANAINGLRRSIEAETGEQWERFSTVRDEASGFLTQTKCRYKRAPIEVPPAEPIPTTINPDACYCASCAWLDSREYSS